MTERLIALVLDEGKWLASAMLVALVVVGVRLARGGARGLSERTVTVWALHLFHGCVIGIMASGHLLAVSVKLAQGTLAGSPALLYPLGIVLALPAWWLAARARAHAHDEARGRRTLLRLDAALVVSLLAFGLHNWPLALPAVLNTAYLLSTRPVVGRTIAATAVVGNLALFVMAVVFLASGRTFEEFRAAASGSGGAREAIAAHVRSAPPYPGTFVAPGNHGWNR